MALWLPPSSVLARGAREPALLTPRNQPKSILQLNTLHYLHNALEGYAVVPSNFVNGRILNSHNYFGIGRTSSTTLGPTAVTLKPVSHLSSYSVVIFWVGALRNVVAAGSVIYTERPNATQIFKLQCAKNDAAVNKITFVTRNDIGGGLLNEATLCEFNTSNVLQAGAFVKISDTNRWLFTRENSAQNTTFSGGNYNRNQGQIFCDSQSGDVAQNESVLCPLVFTFKRAISRLEFDDLVKNPWGLFVPADNDPYLISAGAAVAPGVPTSLLNQNITASGFRSAWTAPA
jgi:hypothetical protein